MSTPISQLPHVPPTVANDPMITQELSQERSGTTSPSTQLDPMVQESIGLLILFVFLHSSFVNNLLDQYLPGMVDTTYTSMQSIIVRGGILAVAVFIIRKWLI
jgi:hypothetical protein